MEILQQLLVALVLVYTYTTSGGGTTLFNFTTNGDWRIRKVQYHWESPLPSTLKINMVPMPGTCAWHPEYGLYHCDSAVVDIQGSTIAAQITTEATWFFDANFYRYSYLIPLPSIMRSPIGAPSPQRTNTPVPTDQIPFSVQLTPEPTYTRMP